MSIINAFDNKSEAILKPRYTTRGPVKGFPETVIASFYAGMYRILRKICPTQEFRAMQCIYRVPIHRFTYQDHVLGLYTSMLGGPASAGLLEEVIAMGAKRVLFFGSTGVLDRDLAAGHLIIPTASYRDEGTSYHYLPPSDYMDIPTAGRLAEIFTELKVPFIAEKVWSTDAIYRETLNNIGKRRREGCVAVDMECASIMAVGQFREIPVYQFLYAEDSLDGQVWDPRTWGCVPESDLEAYLRIALETAIRL